MSSTSRRHLTPLNVALGALAIAGVITAVILVGPESSATTTRERTVTVTKGVVQSTVSGSGNLSPANTMDLSFGATGKVVKVYVKTGDHVTTGQLLARIDPTTAEVDLAGAQATLSSAQDTLDAIESGTATTSTASANSSSAATATITSVKATAAQVTTSAPATTTTPATTVPTTTTPSAAPTTTTTTTTGAAEQGGSSGSSGSGGSTMSEASAVAAVKSAQLAVDNAQDALTETALRAPAAATVAAVNGAVGDQVSAGTASAASGSGSGSGTGSGAGSGGSGATTGSGASSSSSSSSSGFITLTQLSRMHLEVSLSESDINAVEVGQQATVTINAASGEQVAGKVLDIGVLSSSSSSTGTSSAVSYPVTIALTQTTKGLRAGMSATAEIVTGQASGVVVPTQALQGSSVTIVKNGKRTVQRVTTGVAGDSTTQIVSGLSAGQQVVVTSSSATAGANASGGATSGAGGLTGRTGRTGLGTGLSGGAGAGGFTPGAGPPAGFTGGGGR
jgi:multidrug efflux pump subunit AcrA (membrane-fusion protein)